MFKFNAKQRLAIKSWFHAAIATEVLALIDFLKNIHTHFTLKEFFIAAGAALLAPITRWVATVYSLYALKYPMLKPFALWIAKRAAKKLPLGVPTSK